MIVGVGLGVGGTVCLISSACPAFCFITALIKTSLCIVVESSILAFAPTAKRKRSRRQKRVAHRTMATAMAAKETGATAARRATAPAGTRRGRPPGAPWMRGWGSMGLDGWAATGVSFPAPSGLQLSAHPFDTSTDSSPTHRSRIAAAAGQAPASTNRRPLPADPCWRPLRGAAERT